MPGHRKIFWRTFPHLRPYSLTTDEMPLNAELTVRNYKMLRRDGVPPMIKHLVRYTPKDFSTRTIGKDCVTDFFSFT